MEMLSHGDFTDSTVIFGYHEDLLLTVDVRFKIVVCFRSPRNAQVSGDDNGTVVTVVKYLAFDIIKSSGSLNISLSLNFVSGAYHRRSHISDFSEV